MEHWAHTKEQKRKDFWATVRGTLGLIAAVVLLLFVLSNCPEVGVPRM